MKHTNDSIIKKKKLLKNYWFFKFFHSLKNYSKYRFIYYIGCKFLQHITIIT